MAENFIKMNAERRTPNAEPQLCPQFSIIVPAYNTAKYITKCLDSLINQDIPERNYEILITDDGSTDETGKICDSYAERYSFIHVTHTENYGPSHARNVALSKSKGEYILFCDSDDFASPQLISILTKAVEVLGRPDMIIYKIFFKLPPSGWPAYDIDSMKKTDGKLCTVNEVCLNIFTDPETCGWPPNKAVKREMAIIIRFDETLSMHEDEHYFLSMLLQKNNARIYYLHYQLYCYVHHSDYGLTRVNNDNPNKDRYLNSVQATEKMLTLPNLPHDIAEQLRGRIYARALSCLFSGSVSVNSEIYCKLKKYIMQYSRVYYFKSKSSLMAKIKTLIKQCLVFLHIHKPRRK